MASGAVRVYNYNMRKFKIFVTIFVLYECVMLTLLQVYNYCVGVFNVNFCEYGAFKYFLLCIMLPVLCTIFIWWLPDITKLFCNKSCKIASPQPNETIHDVLREIISSKDIERFITAAIIMGIQKFAQSHPKTQAVFDNLLDIINKSNDK